MSGTACEERGADLVPLARGEAPGDDLASHLRACPACAAELEAIRRLLAALPLAHAGVAPPPGGRAALLAALDSGDRHATSGMAPAPRGRLHRWALPAVLVAASAAAGLLVAFRAPPPAETAPPGIATAGGSIVFRSGLVAAAKGPPGTLEEGAVVEARGRTAFQFRFSEDATVEVVAADGVRLRVSRAPPALGPLLIVESAPGPAWFRVTSPATTLEVRAPGLTVRGTGAFTVQPSEVRTGVLVESGPATVEAGGRSVTLAGPAKVDVPRNGPPGEATPGEVPDARAWFHFPAIALTEEAGPEGPEWVIRLEPSIPEPLSLAPWEHFDPLFSLTAIGADGAPRALELRRETLARPAPEGAPAGGFLLDRNHPYILRVNPAALGLPAGRYRVVAAYTSPRPGGTWRGSVQAPSVELEAR